MSNERNELALELFVGDNGKQSREQSIADWGYFHAEEMFQGRTEHYKVMADAVLAAGYRKPRTITTAAQLADAHMVVVRTKAGTIANIVSGRAYCFGYEASAAAVTLALPVTVLWEPTP